jgi:hypothetical protein
LPMKMDSRQVFQYQRYKPRHCKFNDSTRELQTSTKICTYGDKSGVWKDFATGESGDNLLDLLCKARGGDFRRAREEATNWLADPQRYPFAPATPAGMNSRQISQYQGHKLRCCKFNDPIHGDFRRAREEATNWFADPERYSFAPAMPAEMNSRQVSRH